MPTFKVGDTVRVKTAGQSEQTVQTGTIKNGRTVERGSGPMPPPEYPLPHAHEVEVYDVCLDDGKCLYGLQEEQLEPVSLES